MSEPIEGAKEPTEGAAEGDTFLDSLGEAAKGNELFTGVESPEQLATKAMELNTSLDELRAAQPQVPDAPEGYTFEAPEGVELDPEGVTAFQKVAHELKLDPKTAQALMAFDLQRQTDAVTAQNAVAEKAIAQMKEELGGEYDASASLVKKVLLTFDGKAILDTMGEDGELLGNNPALFKFLAKVGSAISEDKLETPTSPGGEKTKKSAAETLYGPGSVKQ